MSLSAAHQSYCSLINPLSFDESFPLTIFTSTLFTQISAPSTQRPVAVRISYSSCNSVILTIILLDSNMPFVTKQPSKIARVLSIEACPPHNVPHEISQYPLYYDACYFPEIHPRVFETIESGKYWLLDALHNHSTICESCIAPQRSISMRKVACQSCR